MLGALPDIAKEYRDLDDMYKNELPADQADVNTAALTI